VGYNESLKAYQSYIPDRRQIEVSRDVTFEEEVSFNISRGSHMEIDQIDPVDHVAPFDVPIDIAVGRKRPTWALQTLQEAEGYVAPRGNFQVRKRPHRYSCYVAAMSHIIHFESSYYEEATSHPIWIDVMMEYQYIMKNDVWDIVPRPEGKSVVTSKWIYKIKHTIDGSIERHKTRCVARGFSHLEGIDYDETFSYVVRDTSIQMIISPTTSMG
jgi:hypothetical protein